MTKKKRIRKDIKIKIGLSVFAITLFCLSFAFKPYISKLFHLEIDLQSNEVLANVIEDSRFQVTYLNVGQGNCTVVRLPDGKVLIVDGGSTMYGKTIYDYLIDHDITKIDYMIATHGDADHIGGLNYLFDKFEIHKIYRPMQIAGTKQDKLVEEKLKKVFVPSDFEDLKDEYLSYKTSIKFVETTTDVYNDFISNVYNETYTDNDCEYASEVSVFYSGLEFSGDNYKVHFYAPFRIDGGFAFNERTKGYVTKVYSNDETNNSSAIFMLSIFDKNFFFSGDASAYKDNIELTTDFEESEFVVKVIGKLNVDVYLVAHHGSRYSSSDWFLFKINPKFAVISVGNNTYGHPNENIITKIKSLNSLESDGLLTTQNNGTITFGENNGNLVYCTEISLKNQDLTISFILLMLIILIVLLVIIWNLRLNRKNNK